MLKKVYIPYKGYWYPPFCKWQGSFQTQHAVVLAADTAKRFFELRGITSDIFDSIVFGTTVPQKMWFFDALWLATLIGNPYISGPGSPKPAPLLRLSLKLPQPHRGRKRRQSIQQLWKLSDMGTPARSHGHEVSHRGDRRAGHKRQGLWTGSRLRGRRYRNRPGHQNDLIVS